MTRIKLCVALGLGIVALPPAVLACHEEAPYLMNASSYAVSSSGGSILSFVIGVREADVEYGSPCQAPTLLLAGLPANAQVTYLPPAPGMPLRLAVVTQPSLPLGVVSTAIGVSTDQAGNTLTFQFSVKGGGSNPNITPTLSPVPDYQISLGETKVYSITLSDQDGNLMSSPETLTISGLPSNALVVYTQVSDFAVTIRVTITNNSPQVPQGVYRVGIIGQDGFGGRVQAEQQIRLGNFPAGGNGGDVVISDVPKALE